MKRLVYIFAILSTIMSACSAPATPTPTPSAVVTEAPVLTDTPTPTKPSVATETLTATETAVPTTNVTCNELSLFLDPALAASTTCEVIPVSTLETDVYPEHTRLTLEGYPDQNIPATISIFPMRKYEEVQGVYLPGQVSAMQALISGEYPGDSVLPFLPLSNVGDFHALYQVVPFMNGSGIFFVPLGGDNSWPVNNHDLFYTYQGLTADGEYWVSAIFPINHAILPTDKDQPGGEAFALLQYKNDLFRNNVVEPTIQALFTPAIPNGHFGPYPKSLREAENKEYKYNFGIYITTLSAQFENQPPDSYTPSLTVLKDLVASIIIQP